MQVKRNDRGFRFLEWRHGAHAASRLIVWINEALQFPVKDGEETVEFPVHNATIVKTRKGSLVMVPKQGDIVYKCEKESGFRGSADLVLFSGGEEVVKVYHYHSGLGRIGETAIALINGKMTEPVVVKWKKTGRRVEKTSGLWRLTADGMIEDVIDDEEVCSLISA